MYTTIKKFCEDDSSDNGLLLIDSPTGSGKTHSVQNFIFDASMHEQYKDRKFFFVTTQKKNLPIEDLKERFKKKGIAEQFYEKVLFIDSNIDAIIIAEKDLNTCKTDDINLRINSNQLVVNGAIVTDNLYFNRTYGAATGLNSKVPGEIVNYDTSAILWGRAKADPNNEHKNLTSFYIHEIAPRY